MRFVILSEIYCGNWFSALNYFGLLPFPSDDQVLLLLAGVAADPGVDLVGLLVPFLAGVASGVLTAEAEEKGGCAAAAAVTTSLSSEFSSPSESDTFGVRFPICNWDATYLSYT